MGDPRQNLLSNPYYLGPAGTRRSSPWFKDYARARFDGKPFDVTPYLQQIQARVGEVPYGNDQRMRPLPAQPAIPKAGYRTLGDAFKAVRGRGTGEGVDSRATPPGVTMAFTPPAPRMESKRMPAPGPAAPVQDPRGSGSVAV